MVQCVGDSVQLRELLSAYPGLYSGAYRAQVAGWLVRRDMDVGLTVLLICLGG